MQSILIVFNILFLITTPSISYLFKCYYPREINGLFGYRTRRSMASQEAWRLANSYASRLLFTYSWVAVGLQVFLFIVFDAKVALMVSAGFWIGCLLSVIIRTEIKLKRISR